MIKVLSVLSLLLIFACTEDNKTEQAIIPKAQLQALEKAKNVETALLKSQQKKEQQYKEQGL